MAICTLIYLELNGICPHSFNSYSHLQNYAETLFTFHIFLPSEKIVAHACDCLAGSLSKPSLGIWIRPSVGKTAETKKEWKLFKTILPPRSFSELDSGLQIQGILKEQEGSKPPASKHFGFTFHCTSYLQPLV